jgi:hypothetical protein
MSGIVDVPCEYASTTGCSIGLFRIDGSPEHDGRDHRSHDGHNPNEADCGLERV